MKIGLQLYSVRNSMEKNPFGTLEQIIAQGYKYIELANHKADTDPGCGFNASAGELSEFLKKHGAKVINSHISPVKEEQIKNIIKYHKAIGNNRLTSAMDFFSDKDDLIRKCDLYNRVGKICHEEGVEFFYHNHFHEFQKFDNKMVLDYIAENTDPSYVKFEIDTYWTMRAGVSPIDIIYKLGKRVKLLHQKDYPKGSKEPVNLLTRIRPDVPIDMNVFKSIVEPSAFTEIGTGIMDIQSIINAGNEVGAEYIILEQDYTNHDEIESIKISLENFKKYAGLS